jgi:hypothetical protein
MNHDRTARSKRTVDQWQKLFSEQSQSGESIKVFCTSRGIGYSTFSKWKSRLADVTRSADQTMHFVELSPPSVSAASRWDVELTLGSNIVLRIAHH